MPSDDDEPTEPQDLEPGRPPPEFRQWLKARRSDLRGRWSTLTPTQVDTLVSAVAAHGSLQVAAGLAGVTLRTVRTWLDRGHADMERRLVASRDGHDPGPKSEYERLLCDVMSAVGFWGGQLLGVVQRDALSSSSTAVKSAQWLLARVGPKIAAPRVEVDELGSMGGHAGEGQGEDRRAELLGKIAEIRARRIARLEQGEGEDGEG